MTTSSRIFSEIVILKIIKIGQCLTKLRLMIAGMFFDLRCTYVDHERFQNNLMGIVLDAGGKDESRLHGESRLKCFTKKESLQFF